jgi:DNA-directed RNA polymerase specialized sigma24 family protein
LLIAEEELEKLITGVPEHLRAVALLMLAGHDTADMAKQFGCSCRTIERRIQELGKLLCKKSDHSGRKAT